MYTTWTGRISIEDFIETSKDGMDSGASIMHRVHGSSVDLAGNRAVVKMKATISQRFALPPDRFVFSLNSVKSSLTSRSILVDAESDCRCVECVGVSGPGY